MFGIFSQLLFFSVFKHHLFDVSIQGEVKEDKLCKYTPVKSWAYM